MDWSYFVSIALFALTMTGTPGPNNVMLTASGANFGYRRSIPHFVGIGTGLTTLIVLCALGLDVLFRLYPATHTMLKLVGCGYLLYLSFKIATAATQRTEDKAQIAKPITLIEAALFQFLNPKAWMMSVAAVGSFAMADSYWLSIAVICALFVMVQFNTSSLWVGFGALIGRWLGSERAQKGFNLTMGGLTASCVLLIW